MVRDGAVFVPSTFHTRHKSFTNILFGLGVKAHEQPAVVTAVRYDKPENVSFIGAVNKFRFSFNVRRGVVSFDGIADF